MTYILVFKNLVFDMVKYNFSHFLDKIHFIGKPSSTSVYVICYTTRTSELVAHENVVGLDFNGPFIT